MFTSETPCWPTHRRRKRGETLVDRCKGSKRWHCYLVSITRVCILYIKLFNFLAHRYSWIFQTATWSLEWRDEGLGDWCHRWWNVQRCRSWFQSAGLLTSGTTATSKRNHERIIRMRFTNSDIAIWRLIMIHVLRIARAVFRIVSGYWLIIIISDRVRQALRFARDSLPCVDFRTQKSYLKQFIILTWLYFYNILNNNLDYND